MTITDQLHQLARLHDEGALTSGEFEQAKRQILGDETPDTAPLADPPLEAHLAPGPERDEGPDQPRSTSSLRYAASIAVAVLIVGALATVFLQGRQGEDAALATSTPQVPDLSGSGPAPGDDEGVATEAPDPAPAESPPGISDEEWIDQFEPGHELVAVGEVVSIDGVSTRLVVGSLGTRIYEFDSGTWARVATFDLPAFVHGAMDIRHADLTGDGRSEFIVLETPNSTYTHVFGRASSPGWERIFFVEGQEAPTAQRAGYGTVDGTTLVTTENPCIPNCAGGGSHDYRWSYSADQSALVSAGPEVTAVDGCPLHPDLHVDARQAATCLYEAFRIGEPLLASTYASPEVVSRVFELSWEPEYPWSFDRCDPPQDQWPWTCWYFIDDDWHGVGVELRAPAGPRGDHFVASIDFYG